MIKLVEMKINQIGEIKRKYNRSTVQTNASNQRFRHFA